MLTTKRRMRAIGGNWSQHRIGPRDAYTLLMRFLNNPCPNIARIIMDNREDIGAIARSYRRLLAQPSNASGFAEGAKLFLRAFEQVELALDQPGYRNVNPTEDIMYQGMRILRGNRC